jgi:kynurenine formamidase
MSDSTMTIIDLTAPYQGRRSAPKITEERIPLRSAATAYTGLVYKLASDSMQGTYLDLPGHIVETDDGRRADTIPVSELYRRPATVLHLDRPLVPGPVSADHLQTALGDRRCHDMLIIHALGDQNTFQVTERSIYLDDSAVDWIINRQCRWLVSDIYESTALHGVFLKLFGAGVATVCEPQNLHLLAADEVLVTILFTLWPNITQIPCRIIAEF